jgi:hypothetical protein
MERVVVFSDAMTDVPAHTRVRLLKMLEEVAASLAEIPVSSVVWDSLEAAPLQLDLAGWRFIYSVSRESSRIVVLEHKGLTDGEGPATRKRYSRP